MDFKEFVNKLEQDLKDALSEISPGADVRQNSVEKLQGSSYTGISITPADSHCSAVSHRCPGPRVHTEDRGFPLPAGIF